MMMRFEFASAGRIVFGKDALTRSVQEICRPGSRVLLLTGKAPERAATLADALESDGTHVHRFAVLKEPTVDTVREALSIGRDCNAEAVIAVGGGSVIDTGKAAAALLTNDGDLMDYLEVVGRGLPLLHPALPFTAVPTTAGTGTEVTKNAVIGVPERRVKVSMRSPCMLPRLAVVDPLLTCSMSPRTTAAVGLDALTQVIEPYLSNQANPLTDALCLEGMARAARALKRAFKNGDDVDAREDMCVTSLFGGLALANAKLGAVHGFAGPLGGMFDAPHGEICGILLPHVMDALSAALKDRAPASEAARRMDKVAQTLTGTPDATAADGVLWIRHLTDALGLPGLQAFGVTEGDIPAIAAQAKQASSMKGSPVAFTDEELHHILSAALTR